MVKFPNCMVLGALAALLGACEKQHAIQSYRVPKDSTPAAPATGGGMGMPGSGETSAPAAQDGPPAITGETPANWLAQPLSSMRQASFAVKGDNGAAADISLIILRGQAGGALENINRWRNQIALPPLTEEDLPKNSKQIDTPLGPLTAVDLEGQPQDGGAEKDGRIVAALGARDGDEWFFKMRGNNALVAANSDAFLKWAASVKKSDAPATPSANQPMSDGSLPPDHPPMGGTPLPAGQLPAGHPPTTGETMPAAPATQAAGLPAVHDAKVQWDVPANWTSVPAAQMRYASFTIAAPSGEKADVSIIVLPGSGGADLDNVNRWRQQVGQAALEASALPAEITTVTAKNSSLSLVRCAGPQSHMLAAWLRQGQNCWFFKLSGPAPLVDQEKDNFLKFLQSVQFPQG